eukprot:3152029-Amphidinium_carterae.1
MEFSVHSAWRLSRISRFPSEGFLWVDPPLTEVGCAIADDLQQIRGGHIEVHIAQGPASCARVPLQLCYLLLLLARALTGTKLKLWTESQTIINTASSVWLPWRLTMSWA